MSEPSEQNEQSIGNRESEENASNQVAEENDQTLEKIPITSPETELEPEVSEGPEFQFVSSGTAEESEFPEPEQPEFPDTPGLPESLGQPESPVTREYKLPTSDVDTSEPASPPVAATIPKSRPVVPRRKKGEIVDLNNCRIGFLGAGKMTEAIVQGLIKITKIDPKRIFISSKSGRNHDYFKQLGTNVTLRNYNIFGRFDCDIVFLVFHGFVIKNLYQKGGSRPMALTTNYIPNQRHPLYILSMVGGVTLDEIKATLLNPENPEKYMLEIHRIMLNYSVAYGMGLGAIDVETDSKKCSSLVRNLLTSISKLEYISEPHMDVACAVGGNGLTFFYYLIASLSDGAFKMGLPKHLALKVAAKTLLSASSSLLESGKHPSDLRDQCTSPSGPAIYGIHVLEKGDCSSGISDAVEASYRRIKELAEVPLE